MRQFFHQHVRARVALLLAAPLSWLGVFYLGSLGLLFMTSVWKTDSFTNKIVREFTLDNFAELLTTEAYRTVTLRTLGIALSVTLLCMLIAVPVSFLMARVVAPKWRPILVALMITPLWASYLVKVYAWRSMLSRNGLADWLLAPLGLNSPGYGVFATILVLTYLWLPYMILPIYSGMERIPDSMINASADLGAKPGRTFRSVVLPLSKPAIFAGSVFTFSLSMGDYIAIQIVGGKSQMLGNVVYGNFVMNLPFAAAFSLVPVLIMTAYLFAIRRTGALENL